MSAGRPRTADAAMVISYSTLLLFHRLKIIFMHAYMHGANGNKRGEAFRVWAWEGGPIESMALDVCF